MRTSRGPAWWSKAALLQVQHRCTPPDFSRTWSMLLRTISHAQSRKATAKCKRASPLAAFKTDLTMRTIVLCACYSCVEQRSKMCFLRDEAGDSATAQLAKYATSLSLANGSVYGTQTERRRSVHLHVVIWCMLVACQLVV